MTLAWIRSHSSYVNYPPSANQLAFVNYHLQLLSIAIRLISSDIVEPSALVMVFIYYIMPLNCWRRSELAYMKGKAVQLEPRKSDISSNVCSLFCLHHVCIFRVLNTTDILPSVILLHFKISTHFANTHETTRSLERLIAYKLCLLTYKILTKQRPTSIIFTIVFHFRHILFLQDLLIHSFSQFHMSDPLTWHKSCHWSIHSILIPEIQQPEFAKLKGWHLFKTAFPS